MDHTFQNTVSLIRTMELLLGLPPMCQYDRVAAPIAVFGATPDQSRPFDAAPPAASIVTEKNPSLAQMSRKDPRRGWRSPP